MKKAIVLLLLVSLACASAQATDSSFKNLRSNDPGSCLYDSNDWSYGGLYSMGNGVSMYCSKRGVLIHSFANEQVQIVTVFPSGLKIMSTKEKPEGYYFDEESSRLFVFKDGILHPFAWSVNKTQWVEHKESKQTVTSYRFLEPFYFPSNTTPN